METFNESIAHIACNTCGKVWQVINEEGTDWDEAKTAELYNSENHNCDDTK
jgi:Fe2+ or Zn2+ uptake regulation protein